MALFTDAKEILDNGNNKQVKKIEDSNGKIIWGSQSAFPYRRLEYIHFSGAERIDTGITPNSNFYFLNAKVPPRSDVWSWIYGATHTVSGVAFRFFWQTNTPNTAYNRLKDLANENTFNLADYQDHVIQFNIRNYFLNNTYGRYWFAAKDLGSNGLSDGNSYSNIVSKYYNSSTYACDFMRFNTTISIGQQHTNNNWQSVNNRAIMDVYRHFIRVDSGTSAYVHNQFPCQRKSDGVCGLYDVVTSTFYPMEGTNVTTQAAGPVADEYWDLTDPTGE